MHGKLNYQDLMQQELQVVKADLPIFESKSQLCKGGDGHTFNPALAQRPITNSCWYPIQR
jgi:hypothetical protein